MNFGRAYGTNKGKFMMPIPRVKTLRYKIGHAYGILNHP